MSDALDFPGTPLAGKTSRRVLRRGAAALAVAATVAATTAAFTPAASASVTAPAENATARDAVTDLTGAHPWSVALPDDFAADAGYRPVMENGLLVDPDGACSSPLPLPHEFDTACKAHDLGYDILRYADHAGQPLGPWARQAVDAALEQRMHAACTTISDDLDNLRCQTLATIATTAVDLNSRRQNYAPPRPEYLFGTRLEGEHLATQLLGLIGPPALALSAFAALILAAIKYRRTIISRLPQPVSQ
ncbi:hypothetical protein [Nocardia terpenica]|nr:hypothetical protein [Nocardia terpenica]NQE91558.1 hypothetical protein [Nocardia terpenica]